MCVYEEDEGISELFDRKSVDKVAWEGSFAVPYLSRRELRNTRV